jgi:hypothetical protein
MEFHMTTECNLDREFIKWFFEDAYPDQGKNRAQTFLVNEKGQRDYWMRLAYMAGARAMAQDVLDTLADYACAVEGLDPELLTPAEIYDRARENLFVYTTRVLDKAKA